MGPSLHITYHNTEGQGGEQGRVVRVRLGHVICDEKNIPARCQSRQGPPRTRSNHDINRRPPSRVMVGRSSTHIHWRYKMLYKNLDDWVDGANCCCWYSCRITCIYGYTASLYACEANFTTTTSLFHSTSYIADCFIINSYSHSPMLCMHNLIRCPRCSLTTMHAHVAVLLTLSNR